MRSTVVYDVWGMSCSASSCNNIPTESQFLSVVAGYVADSPTGSSGGYGSSFLIVLDFEHLVVDSATSQTQANNDEAVLSQFAEWVRSAYPAALVGLYDYDFNNNYLSTRAKLYGTGGFDVFTPSLYQRWSTHAIWDSKLQAAVSNDNSINASLPIYPYISPYTSGNTGSGLLSSSEWQSELNDLIASSVGGAVIWTGAATIDTSDPWYTDLLSVLSPVISPSTTYYLVAEDNSLCTTLSGDAEGSAVNQTACATPVTSWQEWNFQTTSAGKFYITSSASPTHYLTVQNHNVDAGALLGGNTAETSTSGGNVPSASQTWHIVSAGRKYYSGGYYVLIGDASSKCVQAPSGGAGYQLTDAVCSTANAQLYSIHPIP